MIRKLILPALATALLAGCATGYQYRNGSGDYYYGSPAVEYRYYGGYGGGYYGYPYGGYGYGYYGYPYSYGGGYYYYPWYRHGHGHGHHHGDHGDDGDSKPDREDPPWRDLGSIRPKMSGNLPPSRVAETPVARPGSQQRVPVPDSRPRVVRPSSPPRVTRPATPPPRASQPPRISTPRASGGHEGRSSGSRMSEMLRRSQQ